MRTLDLRKKMEKSIDYLAETEKPCHYSCFACFVEMLLKKQQRWETRIVTFGQHFDLSINKEEKREERA